MHLSRTGLGTALVLSGIALLLLAIAPVGWRLGWWAYSFGLYWLMPASGFVGAVAVTVSVVTLALGWSEHRPRGLGLLSAALCLSAVLVYVPWQYSRVRSTLPPIHDITTDTDNPPAFRAVLPARAAEHAGGVNYDDPKLPRLQKIAYPDLAGLKSALPVAKAFTEALHVAKSMPGWTIIAADTDAGHVEASQQSRWFRFTDDMTSQSGSQVTRPEAASTCARLAARGRVIMG